MEVHVNCDMSFNFTPWGPENSAVVARFSVFISIARLLTFAPHQTSLSLSPLSNPNKQLYFNFAHDKL